MVGDIADGVVREVEDMGLKVRRIQGASDDPVSLAAAVDDYRLIDFRTIGRAREHAAGWVHAVGNGTALVLALISLLLRLGDEAAAILPWVSPSQPSQPPSSP